MRIGMYMPYVDKDGVILDGPAVVKRAQMVEAAGLNSVWMGDHVPIPGDADPNMPDPLLYLTICAMGTSDALELGTCIYSLPLRNKYDVAQRFFTMETIAKGRFTLGLGTGSQKIEYDVHGLDWDDRFRRMADHMKGIHEIFDGEPLFEIPRMHPALDKMGAHYDEDWEAQRGIPWAVQVGPPRMALGAWHSESQIKRAATEYDAWLASASPGAQFGGWKKVFKESMAQYRDAGGRRAIAATIAYDLHGEPEPLPDDHVFRLFCGPSEASDRLHVLEDLGFDDIILNVTRRVDIAHRKGVSRRSDFTTEDLEEIRALMPLDNRDYHIV